MKSLAAFNGKRLQTARLFNGMTTMELADTLGVSRQTISDYETCRAKNPDMQKIRTMSQALGFPIDFFLESDSEEVQISQATYFRSQLTTNKKYRVAQEKKIELVSRIYGFIAEYIEFPVLNLPEYHGNDPVEAAALLRNYWNLGERPIDNLIYIVEQNGIIVTAFDTDIPAIDAFSQKLLVDDTVHFVIAFSKNKNTATRIHFDIAHELGHMMLHGWDDDVEALDSDEFKARENEANQFAAAFLLPEQEFTMDLGMYADRLEYYVNLKKKWKVSIAAMIRRAWTLDKISYNQYQFLMRKMQKQGIRKQEPLDDVLTTAPPSLLKTAVEMLLNEDVMTADDFIQELSYEHAVSLYPATIEELLGLRKGTLKRNNVIPIHTLNLKSTREDD